MVAVVDADGLVAQVMRDRGYPVDDFESQSELISVDHPDVVQNYRTGHAIYSKTTTGEASTEDLREAVVSYRELFEELLAEDGATSEGADESARAQDERAPAEDDVRS